MWNRTKVLVTGGASFIGSHLVDLLVSRGARVRVVDNLSSGRREHLDGVRDRIEFLEGDLLDRAVAKDAAHGIDVVFHLAADHGGRGYVDLHQVECARNLGMDSIVFDECHRAGVKKVVYASSGCVYPNHLQTDPSQLLYLTEEMVGPPYDADNMYGWAKLMGEMTLRAYTKSTGMKSASCRFFTVYGPRGKENHAVHAMIARAFIRQDPFEVWGNGEQIRNWTFVTDIVEGMVRTAEVLEDGSAVNLGTMERIRVLDAVRMVMETTGHRAEIRLLPHMPTGPMNRVADNSRAKRALGWEPRFPFREGLRRTIEWYFRTHDVDAVKANFQKILIERKV